MPDSDQFDLPYMAWPTSPVQVPFSNGFPHDPSGGLTKLYLNGDDIILAFKYVGIQLYVPKVVSLGQVAGHVYLNSFVLSVQLPYKRKVKQSAHGVLVALHVGEDVGGCT